ncbi:MAG: glycosyltransferase [Lachnospiraceae bacterium]|nr:glycosyltransferase [Lachnospiraceae bacterium]
MKNILIVGMSSVLGGVETYIYNLIKYIDKDGLSFDFLVVGEKSVFEDEINAMFDDGRNHFIYVQNMKKHYFSTNKKLKEMFNSRRYDLIYINTVTAARTIYCKYGIEKQNIPLIVHSHSSQGNFFRNINNNLYKRYVNKHSCFKLACSDLAGEKVFGKNKEEIVIVPNGIDASRFSYSSLWREEIRKEHGISDNKIVIGHVGRFSAEKNQQFFIELCKKLNDDYVFMCIGDGDTKENVIKMINDNNLSNRFIILPVKSDIERYYSAMDIFAMPSLFEGLPIVAVEAQASGLPIILSSTVSEQTALSDRCEFVSIDSLDDWIQAIQVKDISRYEGKKVIIDNKFEVNETAEMVRKIFDEAML